MRTRFGLERLLLVSAVVTLAACEPQDQRPGLWLRGEARGHPEDWSFTDEHREVSLQVSTPYFLPHSVTIWCAADGESLYIGALDPEAKNWPGWVDEEPDVKLKVGGDVYELHARPLAGVEELEPVLEAFSAKYEFPLTPAPGARPTRYWRLVAR
ncbi:MAG: hypothetical protein QF921_18485 [Pseudomonadales bacterium]|nr:hypothetical protein [Pseudomonadales bacterium]MDP6472343.1 hypothetical protein [Pseudomonadales bacterium]MDP6828139.1 hypothetical protein [Pseudomonadales bacterium]MDP6973476.1 hypothetical protein [Pseudomonadales bacterium]